VYYQNYEDYMRSVLGYPIENQNTYGMEIFEKQFNDTMTDRNIEQLENYYPEIYKLINPVVCEVCDTYNKISTKDELENMVEKVYYKLIENNEISMKLNIENRTIENNSIKQNSIRAMNNETIKQTRQIENRQRTPNNNQFLRDLIRILILNRLIGEGSFPGRPPRPRPPFPGDGPGGMMPRPPMQRNYDEYLKYN